MEKPDQQVVSHTEPAVKHTGQVVKHTEQAVEQAELSKDSDQDCHQDMVNMTESKVISYPHSTLHIKA